MDIRTDRLGVLLDQLGSAVEAARHRTAGLTDAEYLWEPAQPSWSVRRRGEARSPGAFGRGGWVIDHGPETEPAPVTTIAWRIAHLTALYAGRWEWTFGACAGDPKELVEFSPTAADGLTALWAQTDRWLASTAGLTDEQLDGVGFGRYPYGLDPELPFIAIVWWMNREFIHHSAEIALLRDLHPGRA